MEFKIGKHTLQTVVLCESFRNQTNGVLGAGSKRTAGAGFASGQMIEDNALADVCTAHNRDDKIPNLYFVGAGTHPGAGIPGVVGSAKATAALMIPDLQP